MVLGVCLGVCISRREYLKLLVRGIGCISCVSKVSICAIQKEDNIQASYGPKYGAQVHLFVWEHPARCKLGGCSQLLAGPGGGVHVPAVKSKPLSCSVWEIISIPSRGG